MWQFTAGRVVEQTAHIHFACARTGKANFIRLMGRAATAARFEKIERRGHRRLLAQGNGCAAAPSATGGDAASFSKTVSRDGGCVCRCPGRKPGLVPHRRRLSMNKHSVSTTALVDTFFFDRARFSLPSATAVQKKARDYLLYVSPLYDAKKPTPIIVMLHGRPAMRQKWRELRA